MAQILDLANSNNWEPFWSTQVNALQAGANSYYPIPEIICPVLVTSHIIAVNIVQTKGKSYWKFGGFLNQKLFSGTTLSTTPDLNAFTKRKLFLNRVMLFNFPKLTPNYSLSFEVPYWFEDVSIAVWAYTGINTDSVEDELKVIKGWVQDNNQELNILRDDVEDLLNNR